MMYTFNYLISLIDKHISDIDLNKEPRLLYEPIKYLLEAGGKRVRPVMLLMAHNIFSDNIEKSTPAAIAIEMFHNFTLLHDDIMDNSDTRRGRDTVHVKWDKNVAILSGDTMNILAYKYLSQSPEKTLSKVFEIFNQFAIEICEGQRYDMDFEKIDDVSLDRYIDMIRLKTSVLIAGGAKIGAVIGGADEKSAKELYDFGIVFGLAFQLSDDMLDTYGDESTFGKKIGGDIMEAKKTFLLVHTLSNASKQDKASILALLKNKSMTREDKIEQMKLFYSKYNALEAITDKIKEYHTEAVNILNSLDAEDSKKREMLDLCTKLIARKK